MNRMAVFVSGRGSNLQALLDQEGCNIRLVCSHKAKIPADVKAKRFRIPVFKTKKIDFAEWALELKKKRIKRIFLLGFMRLIPAEFVASWQNAMLNVHPSLLPLFPGLNALENSFNQRAKMGVTIHKVVPEMDAGQIVSQSMVLSDSDYSTDPELNNFKTAAFKMTFREHYLVRRVGEKWN